mmetsp:Transcript_47035/g.99967  ORF Transcript_47035/g.99967 Transcript_47035/m.99967 type:complete len:202 (+) Transcript_47035:168-773(+)
MEEPPKIERIISSRGVSLADTAVILKSYLSGIDRYHHHDSRPTTTSEQEETTSNENGEETPRQSRREREEEALIAQMDQLVNEKSSEGMISDDVYERLKMISESISAEVEGRPWSASGHAAAPGKPRETGNDDERDEGASDFLADLEDAERLEAKELERQQVQQQPEQRRQQPPRSDKSKRDRKKEKKAKKAAKKAKKEAK